jgi:outer membrane protein
MQASRSIVVRIKWAIVLGGVFLGSCQPPEVPPPRACIAPSGIKRMEVTGSLGTYGGSTSLAEPNAVPRTEAAPAGEPNQPAARTTPTTGALKIAYLDAILIALENNRSLVVDRFNPPIRQTAEDQARAAFDPDLTAGFTFNRVRTDIPGNTSAGNSGAGGATLAQAYTPQIGLSEFLPTGTTLGVTASPSFIQNPDNPPTRYATHVDLSATQSLLRGYGTEVNLASLRQARLDTLSSDFELRGFAESLVASTEEAYWDYALAQRQIEILTQSLDLAQKQFEDTRERVNVGKVAHTELAAAEAEVALRKQSLIDGRSALAQTRLTLLRLLSPAGPEGLDRDVILEFQPVIPTVDLGAITDHINLALRQRPDLNQARLQVQRGDLEIVKTKNGLLPKLDLFVTLGRTGYANSFGPSVEHLDSKNYNLSAGASLEYPLGNRAARASYVRSIYTRDQSRAAVDNLEQLVESDVRSAMIEITRSREQVTATAASRRLQEVKLEAETERFRLGRSTTLLVAITQRDLLSSQISEVQAVVNYLKALIEFYRVEGSLLQRRGIDCPGVGSTLMPS